VDIRPALWGRDTFWAKKRRSEQAKQGRGKPGEHLESPHWEDKYNINAIEFAKQTE
jgi:hypothetical protein